MSGIVVTNLSGQRPRASDKLLPDNMAVRAYNARLTSGDLRAWYGPQLQGALSKWSAGDPVVAIHRYNGHWYHWVASELAQNEAVKLYPSPVVGSVYDLLYFNENKSLRYSPETTLQQDLTATVGAANDAYSKLLGVVAPTEAATVVPAAAATETRHYKYRLVRKNADGTVSESAESGDKSDTGGLLADTPWTVKLPSAPATISGKAPPTHRRIFRKNLVSSTYEYVGEVAIDVATFLDDNRPADTSYVAPGATWDEYATALEQQVWSVEAGAPPLDDIPISYVYTHVTAYGEESAPSPVQATIPSGQPVGAGSGWRITLPAFVQPTDRATVTHRRLYRTVGTTGTVEDYQLVVELAAASTEYLDEKPDGDTTGSLDTDGWEPPPVGGVDTFTYMGNGVFAITKGRELWLSEPYQPHAWPTDYRRAIGAEGVALESINNSLIVLTSGDPIVLTGTDPEFMSDAKLDTNQPCVSARAVFNVGSAVGYVSPDGLVYAGMGGSPVATRGLYAKEDWTDINPDASAIATRYDDGVLLHTSSKSLLFAPSEENAQLTELTLPEVTALFTDGDTGIVYGAVNGEVWEWNTDAATRVLYLWQSRVFVTPRPVNFAIAAIDSDADGALLDYSPVFSDLRGIDEEGIDGAPIPRKSTDTSLTFKLYAHYNNGSSTAFHLVHTQTVTSKDQFRLPAGFRADQWYFTLEGTAVVHAVYIAETVQELKQMGA